MIWQYLKSNVRGAATKICYGEVGDRISVLGNFVDMILVVNERGDRFHVKAKDISSTPILKTKDDTEMLSMQESPISEVRNDKRSKPKTGTGNNQKGGSLF